jgi:hypothetical protein
MEEARHRHVLIEQFVTTVGRGIAEAEAAAREHQSRGDEGYAELAGRAAEMMRRLLRRIESGEVSEADLGRHPESVASSASTSGRSSTRRSSSRWTTPSACGHQPWRRCAPSSVRGTIAA